MFEIFKILKINCKKITSGFNVYKFDKLNAIQLKNGKVIVKKIIFFLKLVELYPQKNLAVTSSNKFIPFGSEL